MNFHPKFTAQALAGAMVVVLVAEAHRRGIEIDGTEGASIAFIFACIASFLMPPDDGAVQ